ncbi:protein giant [Chironomus tepperi]|uniref:protein giant n=1 Tax=Chironomus tepperi TaxID=113505 RepID=UPI00391F35AE
MMTQFMMDLKNEPIQNLLRNMKSTYEYSFHQHQLLSAAAMVRQVPEESALDLTSKRRDSVESETRKTASPSSFEESPNHHQQTQYLLHNHLVKLTPEHTAQYPQHHYSYEHSSPSTTAAIKNSPLQLFEKFDGRPIIRKLENLSPPLNDNHFVARSPSQMYERYENTEKPCSPPQMADHEDSSDAPNGTISNISSSSSVASSQKSPTSSNSSMMVVGRDGKLSRPFKAYPKDPLSLAAAGSILDQASAEKYAVFRKRMLEQIHAANGGNPVINNPKMRRISTKGSSPEANNNEPAFTATESTQESLNVSKSSNGFEKDDAYFERRKKNNAAAKKSRDRRRIKEDEIAIRAAFLERENIELKFELAAARKQLALYGVSAGITT